MLYIFFSLTAFVSFCKLESITYWMTLSGWDRGMPAEVKNCFSDAGPCSIRVGYLLWKVRRQQQLNAKTAGYLNGDTAKMEKKFTKKLLIFPLSSLLITSATQTEDFQPKYIISTVWDKLEAFIPLWPQEVTEHIERQCWISRYRQHWTLERE